MPDVRPPSKAVNDVSKPGVAAPSATAKPVIVSNRPQVADPTLVAEKDAGEEKKPLTHSTNRIEPPKGSDIQVEETDQKDSSSDATKNTESSDSGAVDVIAESALANKKEDPAEAEREAHVKKLIEEKTLHVKISEGPTGGSLGKVFLVLLLLFVAAAVVNFLIDAEVLDIGISPLTNLL